MHLTYGEDRRYCEKIDIGGAVAMVTFAQYKTACGKWVEDTDDGLTHSLPDVGVSDGGWKNRPRGICRRCWHDWRRACIIDAGFSPKDVARRYRYVFDAPEEP